MRRGEEGFTLLELLAVVALLAALALGVVSSVAAPGTGEELGVAAEEVAAALRHARSQALLTGSVHGVNASAGGQQLQVYRLDLSGGAPDRSQLLVNPLDKRPYVLGFGDSPPGFRARLETVTFSYAGLGAPVAYLEFDPWGSPRYHDGATVRLLESGQLQLLQGASRATVEIAPLTGRVRVL